MQWGWAKVGRNYFLCVASAWKFYGCQFWAVISRRPICNWREQREHRNCFLCWAFFSCFSFCISIIIAYDTKHSSGHKVNSHTAQFSMWQYWSLGTYFNNAFFTLLWLPSPSSTPFHFTHSSNSTRGHGWYMKGCCLEVAPALYKAPWFSSKAWVCPQLRITKYSMTCSHLYLL